MGHHSCRGKCKSDCVKCGKQTQECKTIVCPKFTCVCGTPGDDDEAPRGTLAVDISTGNLHVMTNDGWRQLQLMPQV